MRTSAVSAVSTLAEGQSIDNLIQKQLANDGNDPLTLLCGGDKSEEVNEVLSYRGPLDLRGAERNPYNAYLALFGLSSTLTPAGKTLTRARRKSGRKACVTATAPITSSPTVIGSAPERFGDNIRSEIAKWAKVIKAANIKVEVLQ